MSCGDALFYSPMKSHSILSCIACFGSWFWSVSVLHTFFNVVISTNGFACQMNLRPCLRTSLSLGFALDSYAFSMFLQCSLFWLVFLEWVNLCSVQIACNEHLWISSHIWPLLASRRLCAWSGCFGSNQSTRRCWFKFEELMAFLQCASALKRSWCFGSLDGHRFLWWRQSLEAILRSKSRAWLLRNLWSITAVSKWWKRSTMWWNGITLRQC